jgi:hypothetical protein
MNAAGSFFPDAPNESRISCRRDPIERDDQEELERSEPVCRNELELLGASMLPVERHSDGSGFRTPTVVSVTIVLPNRQNMFG